jgi:TDG/mug DNA glycosylase family protein
VTILPDILQPGLRLVLCGTAASAASARVSAYYGGPGNRFWDILFETGLTPKRLCPSQFREVTQYGIGLTDIVKTASGSDASLPAESFDPDRLRDHIFMLKPRFLAFNGKRSAKAFFARSNIRYGLQTSHLGSTSLFVLPSTSGAARGFWDPQHWHDLAGLVGVGPKNTAI